MAAIAAMQAHPLRGDVVKLGGHDGFRRRVGAYRIIFSVDFGTCSIGVLDIVRRTTTTYR
jgi:mRNA-degrading endonuclease RelE of RelBE toxin-antitoxin system